MRWMIAVLLLTCSACAGSAGRTGPVRPESGIDYDAIYAARADSMRSRFSEADVRFVTGMIAHHAQALEMSRLAEANGAGSQVRVLAARIINGQLDEIASMQRWLQDRNQPVPAVDPSGRGAADHAEHGMTMPGMLTPQQMTELAAARGSTFDRLFLRGMIQHHRGAVTMVTELFATDGALQGDEIFKIASDIQADQRTEIERMERMLAALP